MKTDIGDLSKVNNFTDESVRNWKAEVIKHLLEIYENFGTHAMSDYALKLSGQKEMLLAMINFIDKN